MRQLKFMISGGGTGGHIYPAIAIADELKSQFPTCEILFVGAQDKMEMQKVPQSGYRIEGLWISGIQRSLTLDNLSFPLKLWSSMRKSKSLIKQFKPDVVIGTGGFASGPLLKVASNMGIPTVIQEQNSFPGITNKWLSKKAKVICVAYEGLELYFKNKNVVCTGNPVRQDLLSIENNRYEGLQYYNLDPSKPVWLVLGGSLGAKAINELVVRHFDYIEKHQVQILWQCGKRFYEQYKEIEHPKSVHVLPYIERMDLAYAVADIVISRAGASSVSELAIVGKPVVFIPSPHVAEDHQTKNAKALVDKNAAIMIPETELKERFLIEMGSLLTDSDRKQELSANIKLFAKPDATKQIVSEIKQLIK